MAFTVLQRWAKCCSVISIEMIFYSPFKEGATAVFCIFKRHWMLIPILLCRLPWLSPHLNHFLTCSQQGRSKTPPGLIFHVTGQFFPSQPKQCLQGCAGKQINTYCYQIGLVINKGNKKTSLSFQYSKILLASSDRAIGTAGFFSVDPLQFFRSRALVVKNNVSQIRFSCV